MTLAIENGTIIDERYEILAQLGAGGMGTVYKARQVGLERIVAVKVLHLNLIHDHDSFSRFEREALVLASLSHPNLGIFYSYGRWQGQMPYIVMEYIEGNSLRAFLDSRFENEQTPELIRLKIELTLSLISQVCDAMAYVHKHNIIHRDLKPTNIIVANSDGVPKVVDFGLAKILTSDSSDLQKLTQTGMLVGTAQYLSPEMCKGGQSDHRADIYSLGCILYECLTDGPPHSSDNPIGLLNKHVHEPIIVPSKKIGYILPVGLDEVTMRALEKNPSERYQSMSEFLHDLQQVKAKSNYEVRKLNVALPKFQGFSQSKYSIISISAIALCLIAVTVLTILSTQTKNGFTRVKIALHEDARSLSEDKATLSENQAMELLRDGSAFHAKGQFEQAVAVYTKIISARILRKQRTLHLRALAWVVPIDQNPIAIKSYLDKIQSIGEKMVTAKAKASAGEREVLQDALVVGVFKLNQMNDHERASLFIDMAQANYQHNALIDVSATNPMMKLASIRRRTYMALNQKDRAYKVDSELARQLDKNSSSMGDRTSIALLLLADSISREQPRERDLAVEALFRYWESESIEIDQYLRGREFSDALFCVFEECAKHRQDSAGVRIVCRFRKFVSKMGEASVLKLYLLEALVRAGSPIWKNSISYDEFDAFCVDIDSCIKQLKLASDEKKEIEFYALSTEAEIFALQNRLYKIYELKSAHGATSTTRKWMIEWTSLLCSLMERYPNLKDVLSKKELQNLIGDYLEALYQLVSPPPRAESETRILTFIPGLARFLDYSKFITELLYENEGREEAVAFKKRIFKVLVSSGKFKQLDKRTQLGVLLIPGRYPGELEQVEFGLVKEIANAANTEPSLRCLALVAMSDGYRPSGAHDLAKSALDRAINCDVPNSDPSKYWSLFYRGTYYDQDGDSEKGAELLWRALGGIQTYSRDTHAFDEVSNALIEHYKNHPNGTVSIEKLRSAKDPVKFFALKPRKGG